MCLILSPGGGGSLSSASSASVAFVYEGVWWVWLCKSRCSRFGVSREMETVVLGILVLFNFSCVLGGLMRSRCLMTLSDGLKMVLSTAASFGLRMRSRSRSIDALRWKKRE
ncbi:hypothetical protein F2Q69_00056886 [Brassica cretica]|uniref:Uncharacterized protein n=1 Tax=Brassica cretica TaxID=69181 RepID=A0A8S9MXB9_BRACR|nr:hypothetical protein F2Q69_00056886 [Brassica cretica]